MDGIFWGIVFVLFLVWLSRRSKKHSNQSNQPNDVAIDFTSKDYAQGYWDGYRAHQKESGAEISHPTHVANEAHKIIEQPKPINQLYPEALPNHQPTPTYSMGVTVNNDSEIISSAKLKEKHDLQNINITLYVASFLLVAAAALFVFFECRSFSSLSTDRDTPLFPRGQVFRVLVPPTAKQRVFL